MVFWSNVRRLAYIVTVIARHVIAHLFGVLVARWPSLSRPRLSGPERLRLFFEDLGGTFIKFGQMLALQPDILSLEYCNALFNLLDRCAPFEYGQIERIFLEETGKRPAEIFDYLDTQPLATASIGQVHLGSLGGRKVAVKVQRPSVETDFAGDIRLMIGGVNLIKNLRLKFIYWMIEPMSEFVNWTKEELDYRSEARYMQQLHRNARNNPCERVPQVFWQYTTRRILVTEFIEGDTVLAYLRAMETNDELMFHRLNASGFDVHEVARHVIDNFLGDAFQHGIFHADLHPANLMILPGNVIGYVDFGITGVISGYSRQNLIALTLAYTRGDLDGMCEAFVRVSAVDKDSDLEAFSDGLKRLAQTWYAMNGQRTRLRKNFTMVMLDMLRLSRATNIWPERDVIKYIRSSIAIDGLITRFAPGFDVGHHLETVCSSFIKLQARRSLFSHDAIVNWSSASGHLVRNGILRVSSLLQQIYAGQLPAQIELVEPGHDDDQTSRMVVMRVTAIILAFSILINLTGGRMQFGINLFTAEVVLLVIAPMVLLRRILRLT